jgi:hypothetical protein
VDHSDYKAKSWRDYRTSTKKQRIHADFLIQRGIYERFPALRSRTPFAFYGGAGWGGKSYQLRTLALEIALDLRARGLPNLWGGLYTLTFPDLTARHISKLATEFQGIATVRETREHGLHIKFLGEGLGGVYLSNIASEGNLKSTRGTRRGAERSYGLIDESTEFTYDQFDTIKYQIRPTVTMPYIAIGLAGNPDGIGHGWNKKIFHPSYRDLEHPFYNKYKVSDVLFVQALKSDNPMYAANKEIVDAQLGSIADIDIRRARDEGAWDIYGSGRFPVFRASQRSPEDNVHGCTLDDLYQALGLPLEIPFDRVLENAEELGLMLYGALDYGTSVNSMTAILLFLVDWLGRRWWVKEIKIVGLQLEQQCEVIHDWVRNRGRKLHMFYCDPALIAPAAEDMAGISRIERFRKNGIVLTPGINNRVEGWAACDTSLFYKRDAEGKMVRAPISRFLFPEMVNNEAFGVPTLISSIPDLPRDKNNPEDVDSLNGIWHFPDAWRYGEMTYSMRGHKPRAQIQEGTREWYNELLKNDEKVNRDIFGFRN